MRPLPSMKGCVIRVQTAQIEKTDALIKAALNEEELKAVSALDAIAGIGVISAEQIIAETGTDMGHFRNQHTFSNWIGVDSGNNESAGKRKSGKTTHGNKTLKSTLTQCAKSAKKVKASFFSAQYHRLLSHQGKNRATMAVAHSMAIAIYFVLQGMEFKDLGTHSLTMIRRLTPILCSSPNLASVFPMKSCAMHWDALQAKGLLFSICHLLFGILSLDACLLCLIPVVFSG